MQKQELRERVTITLDPELAKKIRLKQARGIKSLLRSYSFSQALEDVLRSGLRNEGNE